MVVIFVVSCMENRRTSTDVYLMHLAIADLFFALTLPFWAAYYYAGHWMFGTFMCKLISGLQEATFYCCVFLLACISFDRYLAIVKATQFLTQKRHLVGIVKHGQLEDEFADSPPHFGILPAISRHDVLLRFHHVHALRSRNSQKQKAMRVILSVVLAFIICWLPNNILELIDTLMRGGQVMETCELRDSIDVALYVTQAMTSARCAINPILYVFIWKKLRNQLLTSLFKKGLLGRDTTSKYQVGSVNSFGSTRQMLISPAP
ncbi:hypothetical protein G5714_009823 [Onychostoma macrolepis]|uniref:G-protein coupled receptors family 1 profile domain-containing protein n=1 Tax=Onychostoma macrolepis TaxID=369639 RepID=A0A7J6CND4_9TELE|nr:hypothetical protein G5714_009823 [Onychostoma macrolepis]